MNNQKSCGRGRRVRQLRKERGLSQSGFAVLIGRNFSTVSKIESGGLELSKTILETICTVFGVRRDWLLNGTGARYGDRWPLLEKRAHELGEDVALELARLMSLREVRDSPAGPSARSRKGAHERSHIEKYSDKLTDILAPGSRHKTQAVIKLIDAFFEILEHGTCAASGKKPKSAP